MAGFWETVLGSSPYGRMQLAEQQQQARGQQFADLSGRYGATLPGDQAGPTRPAGPDFWMQAAAIPGYQQMAEGMMREQQQQQFMARAQQAEREFWTQNERATDRLGREQQARQWGAISPFQQATLGLQRRGQDMAQQITPYQQAMLGLQERAQQVQEARALYEMQGPRGGGGALPGSPLYDTQLKELQKAQGAVESIGQVRQLWGGTGMFPGMADRDRLAQAKPHVNAVVSALAQAAGSGVLDKGEYERYKDMLAEPSFYSSNARMLKGLSEIEAKLRQGVEDVYARNPNLPQIEQAPAGFARRR